LEEGLKERHELVLIPRIALELGLIVVADRLAGRKDVGIAGSFNLLLPLRLGLAAGVAISMVFARA
jgi:hypothetical protein